MEKGHADQAADEREAHRVRRDLAGLVGFEHLRVLEEHHDQLVEKPGEHETKDRRKQKRRHDLLALMPVDRICQGCSDKHCMRDRHADDRTDVCVGRRVRDSVPPRCKVPAHRRDDQREHERCFMNGVDSGDHLLRQKENEPKCDSCPAKKDAKEVHQSRKPDRMVWLHGVRVDHGCHGVGRVMEPVDRFLKHDQHKDHDQRDRCDFRKSVQDFVDRVHSGSPFVSRVLDFGSDRFLTANRLCVQSDVDVTSR